MISREIQSELFEIADYFENLVKEFEGLKALYRSVKIWGNYEIRLVAEIITNYKTEEIPIDFIKNAKPFTINTQQPDVDHPDTVTIVKFSHNGIMLFPDDKGEFSQEYAKNYREYCFEKYSGLYHEFFEEEEYNERKSKFINKIPIIIIKPDSTNNYLEMNPSLFYYVNELISQMIVGGLRKDFLYLYEDVVDIFKDTGTGEDTDYENIIREHMTDCWMKFLEISSGIKLFFEACVWIDGTILTERISSLGSDLINQKLRGFHDSKNYCPLGKSEYISGLSLSHTVKERLNETIEAVEKLELTELKRGAVKEYLVQFKTKGWLDEYHTLEKVYEELIDSKSKQEASQIQSSRKMDEIIRILFEILENNLKILGLRELPSFVEKLNDEYKERYLQLLLKFKQINIHITNTDEEIGKYIDVVSELGRFVCNIMSIFFEAENEDVTISNLKPLIEKNLIKTPLKTDDQTFLMKYSEEYGRFYNLCRKEPEKVIIDFNKTCDFICDSHKILDMVMKYNK